MRGRPFPAGMICLQYLTTSGSSSTGSVRSSNVSSCESCVYITSKFDPRDDLLHFHVAVKWESDYVFRRCVRKDALESIKLVVLWPSRPFFILCALQATTSDPLISDIRQAYAVFQTFLDGFPQHGGISVSTQDPSWYLRLMFICAMDAPLRPVISEYVDKVMEPSLRNKKPSQGSFYVQPHILVGLC